MILFAAKPSGSGLWLLLIVAAYIAFYYFIIRPRMKRQRALRTTGIAYQVGDKVQTIGGLVGTVAEMDDHSVILRSVDGTQLEFLRAAIAKQYQPPVVADSTEGDAGVEGDPH